MDEIAAFLRSYPPFDRLPPAAVALAAGSAQIEYFAAGHEILTRGGQPHLWDFGSAAKHHRLYCPWLPPENVRGGMIGLRGAVAPEAGLFTGAAKEIADILQAEGVADMPIGVDIVEPPMLAALEACNITVKDGTPAAPARNVIGILEGSDPALKGQYVAVGAHNDHVGISGHPVDHDSLRAFNAVVRPGGAESDSRAPTAAEQAQIKSILDSLRKIRNENRLIDLRARLKYGRAR